MRPQPLFNYTLVVVLKAGEMRGTAMLRITPITPSGRSLEHADVNVLFEGDERGVVLQAPLGVVAEEEGLYWIEVTLDGTLLTRIPLRTTGAYSTLA
jgi:hypothetical protein